MSIFEYQCSCGVQFEFSTSMANYKKPQDCPACGKKAERLMPSDVNGVFALATEGIGPQNTGVSEYDLKVDRAIGADAKKGWEAIEKRNTEKEAVLRQAPGASSLDLSLNPDGSYRVMTPQEKKIHARALMINHLGVKHVVESKRKQRA